VNRRVLRVSPTEVRVEVAGAALGAEAHEGDPAAALGRLAIHETMLRRGQWTVVIGRPQAQLRRLASFPPVSARKLRAIVATQPARYFRPVDGDVITDAAWFAGGPGERLAILVAVPERAASSLLASARANGVRIDRLAVAGMEETPFSLFPSAERRRRIASSRGAVARLAGLVAAVWVAGVGYSAMELTREAHQIERRLATVRPAAAAVRRAREAAKAAESMLRVVDSVRSERATAVRGLGAIVDGLTREAYLRTVVITQDSLEMAGSAPSPSAVVKRLADGGRLEAVKLHPPRARSSATGLAEFEVAARLRRTR